MQYQYKNVKGKVVTTNVIRSMDSGEIIPSTVIKAVVKGKTLVSNTVIPGIVPPCIGDWRSLHQRFCEQ